MKNLIRFLYRELKTVSPFLFFVIAYKRASFRIRDCDGSRERADREQLFEDFLERCDGKRCLQVGVKDNIGRKFGPNWVSVDKYDQHDFIDHHYDIHDLQLDDESFAAVVCWSILEHIPYPQKAINELHRVLEPGGEIWVQLPFLYPFHEVPKDYWRVTPDGLRIWMKDFKEVSCGCHFWAKTSLIAATYFHGTKL